MFLPCCSGRPESRKAASFEEIEPDSDLSDSIHEPPKHLSEPDLTSSASSSPSPTPPRPRKQRIGSLKSSSGQCLHGALPRERCMPDHADSLRRQELVQELMETLQMTLSAGGSFSVTVKDYVVHPDVRPHVDKHLLAYTLALAADQILVNQQTALAKILVEVAKTFSVCVEEGVDEYARVIEAARSNAPIVPAPEWFRRWNEGALNICSDRDVVLYLDQQLPCDCLERLAEEALHQEDTKWCHKCVKSDLDSRLLVCSQCHMVRYCSKECQSADWEDHKRFCKTLSTTSP